MADIYIWGFGYGSEHDEATKLKVNELVNTGEVGLITTGRIGKLWMSQENKLIFNRSFMGIALFFIYSILIMPFRCNMVMIMARLDSPWLFVWTRLLKHKVIHIFSNECIHSDISEYPFYFRHVFKHTKYVGITCIREKRVIDQQLPSKDRQKTVLFLPFVNSLKYYYCDPPNVDTFTITFASAPMTESAFDNKGIDLLLEGFKRFSEVVDAKLIIIWRREKYTGLLYIMENLIKDYCLEGKVEIINEEIEDMRSIYANSHTTILVNRNHKNTPNYPQSLLEALGVGRPIITSNVNEIADIILKEDIGSVCELNCEAVYDAMMDCYANYSQKQLNTRDIIKKYFDLDKTLKSPMFSENPPLGHGNIE